MARRGQFGRLPSAAPDLTNTIVALIREAMAMEDSNYVDAWKSGGKVNGKGVDDDRLLAHLKARRDNLDPDDPQYQEWNNRYTQYDFAIHESKMSLAFDQGKVKEGTVSEFYRKWAARPDVQQDSEFYRSLLSKAAKWKAAAQHGRAAGGARAKAEAHNRWAQNVYRNEVEGADKATGYLLTIAKVYGAAPPNADSLDDVDVNSAAYGKVLDVIEDGVADDPRVQQVLDEATRSIRQSEPGFKWSVANVNALTAKGDRGLERLIGRSTTKTERESWSRHRTQLKYEATRTRQVQANERITIATDSYADALDLCQGDPACGMNATKTFRDSLAREARTINAGISTGMIDVPQAALVTNTLMTLDDIIAGKNVSMPSGTATNGPAPAGGYTIFDAGADNESARGFLGNLGNDMNAQLKFLGQGGWVSTEPQMNNGQPVVDGDGNYVFQHRVHPPSELPPANAVKVEGVATFVDNTRPVFDPHNPTQPLPSTVTATMWVASKPPTVTLRGPGGETLDPETTKPVSVTTPTGAAPPTESAGIDLGFVQMDGVIGPDGNARTLYRTGTGKPGDEFLFHTLPPVPEGTQMVSVPGPGGVTMQVPQVQVTQVQDPTTGATRNVIDNTGYKNSAAAHRQVLASGGYVMGTYATMGGGLTAQAVADIYSRGQGITADKLVDDTIRKYQMGLENLPLTGPGAAARDAGIRDLVQIQQTRQLYKDGTVAKAGMSSAYETMNARTPGQQQLARELGVYGITDQRYGTEEVNRRVKLLEQLHGAEDRVDTVAPAGPPSPFGVGAYGRFGAAMRGTGLASDEDAIKKARGDIFNPLISVSNIKIPGMPSLFPGVQAPGQAVSGMGRTVTVPGQVTPFAPPTPRGPGVTVPKAPQFNPSNVVPGTPGPTSTARVFTPPPPPKMPPPPEPEPTAPPFNPNYVFTPPKPTPMQNVRPGDKNFGEYG